MTGNEGAKWSISSEGQMKARGILDRYGRSSMDYFTIFPDKTLFFEDDLSFISYRTAENVAIALGDPVGPEEREVEDRRAGPGLDRGEYA